jgi:protein gp37
MNPLYHHTFAPWHADGERRILAYAWDWMAPIEWNRAAGEANERRRLMVTCDLFEEFTGYMELQNGDIAGIEVAGGGMMKADMDDARMRIYSMIEATPNLDWLIISESPSKIDNIVRRCRLPELRNLLLGVLIRTQAEADERIPHLLRVPAAVRFALCEPREEIDLLIDGECSSWACKECGSRNVDTEVCVGQGDTGTYSCRDCGHLGNGDDPDWKSDLNLLVCRGETGPDARPMHPNWVRGLRDQAAGAGVPFTFEGWGEWLPVREIERLYKKAKSQLDQPNIDRWGQDFEPTHSVEIHGRVMYRVGSAHSGRVLDGKTHDGLPEVAR